MYVLGSQSAYGLSWTRALSIHALRAPHDFAAAQSIEVNVPEGYASGSGVLATVCDLVSVRFDNCIPIACSLAEVVASHRIPVSMSEVVPFDACGWLFRSPVDEPVFGLR